MEPARIGPIVSDVCRTVIPTVAAPMKLMILMMIQLRGSRRSTQERHEGIDEHAEGVAVRTHQEPVPDQGREDHAGDHYQDDAHSGAVLFKLTITV